jgi:hypothetical protein
MSCTSACSFSDCLCKSMSTPFSSSNGHTASHDKGKKSIVWRRYDCTCNHRDPAACVPTGPVCCITDAAEVRNERAANPDQHQNARQVQRMDCMPESHLTTSVRTAALAGPRVHPGPRLGVSALHLWCVLHVSPGIYNAFARLMAPRCLPCRLLRIQELHAHDWPLRLSATVCCQGIEPAKEGATHWQTTCTQHLPSQTGRQQDSTGCGHSELSSSLWCPADT